MKLEVTPNKLSAEVSKLAKTPAEKKALETGWTNVGHVTDPIKEALLRELQKNLMPKKPDFTSVDWAASQADRLGYIRGLEKAIKLLP